jgi:hypothetical protein
MSNNPIYIGSNAQTLTSANAGQRYIDIWSTLQVLRSPTRGPTPELAQGKPRGVQALPGNAATLPGYLTQNTYQPNVFEYQPVYQRNKRVTIPRTISVGNNGRDMVGTYDPHDFTPAVRAFTQNRSAPSYQMYSFPPDFRNLLSFQYARTYALQNIIVQARPLPQSNYFLGYTVDPKVAQQLSGGSLGVK